jgi:membrane protein implicated in regulation of membrane protease activity
VCGKFAFALLALKRLHQENVWRVRSSLMAVGVPAAAVVVTVPYLVRVAAAAASAAAAAGLGRVLQNQRSEHDRNEEEQEADALEGPRGLLVLLGFVQLLQPFLRVLHHLRLQTRE